MKLAYITAHTPFGKKETFILQEMLALLELGVDLLIVPRNPPREVFHIEGEKLLNRTIGLPLLNWQIFAHFLKNIFLRHYLWLIITTIFHHSRSLKIALKNLTVLPKAVFIADLLGKMGVAHIHAHWGSTTATLGWIVSRLTKIPWSMTLHRLDITENNLLKLKVQCASFVRCISEDGRKDLLQIIGREYEDKVKVVHMGVRVKEAEEKVKERKTISPSAFLIACPGDFVPKKGQRFLITACNLLVKSGVNNIRCLLIGDGPMEIELRQQVAQMGLSEIVTFTGRLPHSELLEIYEKGEVALVVLPSVVTSKGDKEGIPVSLMEAMAYKIPVISTNTGGIYELLSDGAGLMVAEKSPEQLAEAILRVMSDERVRKALSEKGFMRVKEEFEIGKIAKSLLQLIKTKGKS